MKYSFFKLSIICSAIILSSICLTQAQSYKVGRIQLKNGTFVTGKNMTVTNEDISIFVGTQQASYPKSDIIRADYKKGWAGAWAAGCGLSCFTFILVGNLANSENSLSGGQIVLGSLLWGGISSGVGGLIGYFTDSYKTAYINSDMSFLKNFNIQLCSSEKKQLGLTYTVSIPSF